MTNLPSQDITSIPIEEELKRSYLDYAMSVIIGRALPDVRDGLKPVHRRVLYAMHQMGNDWNKPYKKSARVVGNVIGQFHPHGDVAVYDTIVRLAQPFSLRYPLVDGQGNFGSIDGDAPAAMRYTEVRMTRLTHELLADLDKETVTFVPNYDGNEQEPIVLPTKIPNLLINGSSGIAVGMATNIPPHNLKEVLDACFLLIDKPSATLQELMAVLPGPDLPTKAFINGKAGIVEAYKTGKGKMVIRAKTEIETDPKTGKQTILVHELPFQVNKAHLIEKIAELIKDKKIEGISTLRDESDKDGLRIVIELKRGENADVLLNNLLSHTQLQVSFGINMVALVDGQPRLLPIKNILEAFLKHRRQIVTRRTLFELKKARERAHILESLAVALSNMDDIITLIKQAKSPSEAKEQILAKTWPPGTVLAMLQNKDAALTKPKDLGPSYGLLDFDRYQMTPVQAQAILDLRLHRLTALEREKILKEYGEIIVSIQQLLSILSSPAHLMNIIREELKAIQTQYGDERKTKIISEERDLSLEDLIEQEEVAVTLSHLGYIKAQPTHQYDSQHRGGKGKSATPVKTDDFIERLLVANTHDTLLCFSNLGKVYWLKVYQLPQGSTASKGKPIVNLLSLAENERITTILAIHEYASTQFITMATQKGLVKKTALSDFSNPRATGIIAIHLQANDMLVGAYITNGEQDIMLFTDHGKVIRFSEKDLRSTGRTSQGVRGIRIPTERKVIALLIAEPDSEILTATRKGYGKRTAIAEYRLQGRGGSGVISIQVHERNGPVISAIAIREQDDVMLISDQGKLVRIPANEISVVGRNTKGVRLIQLAKSESLVAVERVIEEL